VEESSRSLIETVGRVSDGCAQTSKTPREIQCPTFKLLDLSGACSFIQTQLHVTP